MIYDHITTHNNLTVGWWQPNNTQAWNDVWVSDEFRQLVKEPSWLRDEVLPVVRSRPIGWFSPPEGSRFYFSAWLMNAIMLRQYENPLIQDLYVLHEALHAATLDRYFDTAKNLANALRVNEIEVSLETECWVYLRHPQWIGKTFDNLWVMQPHIIEDQCSQERLSHMTKEHEYHRLRSSVPWIVSRAKNIDSQLWWTRRAMNNHAQTHSDMLVSKYDRMSEKWIAHIEKDIPLVQYGRERFNHFDLDWKKSVDEWMGYGWKHQHQGLPFGFMQLGVKR